MYLENNQFMSYDTRRELYHHGVLGQKWGVRRYQNEDGTLTEAGKRKEAKLNERKAATKKTLDFAKSKSVGANIGNVALHGIYAPAYTAARARGKSLIAAELRITGQSIVSQLSGAVIGAGLGYVTGGLSGAVAGANSGAKVGYVAGAYTSFKKNNK